MMGIQARGLKFCGDLGKGGGSDAFLRLLAQMFCSRFMGISNIMYISEFLKSGYLAVLSTFLESLGSSYY